MSYNQLLDSWFDYPLISYGIPLLIFVLMVVFRDKLSQGKEYSWSIVNAYYAIPVLMIFTVAIFNPMYLGFGSPVGVAEVRYENGELYVLDYIGTAGSRYASGEPCYRIHVLDPSTGSKKIRFRVGYDAQLIGVRSDTIAVAHYGDVGYYSTKTGKLLVTYSTETLPKLFSQLSSGVDRFMWGDGRNIMEVSSLDGKEWNLYTKTRQLVPVRKDSEKENYIPTGRLFIKENDILKDNRPFGSDFIEMTGKDGTPNLKYIFNAGDSLLNAELIFLDGHPVALSNKEQSFLILHYETLKKEKSILTSMSFTGAKLWELKQSELYPFFNFRTDEGPCIGNDSNSDAAFFNLGGDVFSVRMKDGKILWRQKL